MRLKCWIEAMRLRTLPVSVAGVIMGCGYAMLAGGFRAVPAALCLAVAILAQIASNFANEYFDFRNGLDRPGREGPRRGVTEGDITPRAMLTATLVTLAAACVAGLCLIPFGGWWLIFVGAAIAAGIMAYSAGPYPLSHHGLGEVAVIIFFGIIPVCFTAWLQTGVWSMEAFTGSLSAGLLGANVLIINNYRDVDDDRSVGKNTLAVLIGASAMPWLYAINALLAVGLMSGQWHQLGCTAAIIIFAAAPIAVAIAMTRLKGRRLTPLLGITALLMLAYCITFVVAA